MGMNQKKIENNQELNKYRLDLSKEEVVNSYVREWVLEWVKEYHPEVFQKSEEFISSLLEIKKIDDS
jgi:hypothetical protein